jgi:hypothetical protein
MMRVGEGEKGRQSIGRVGRQEEGGGRNHTFHESAVPIAT